MKNFKSRLDLEFTAFWFIPSNLPKQKILYRDRPPASPPPEAIPVARTSATLLQLGGPKICQIALT